MIAIVLANTIAIGIIYQFIRKLPKKEILVFIAISFAIIYIAISIVYWISGFGIEESIHEGAKSYVIYLFVPVNVILFVPYLASQYRKLRQKQIKSRQLKNKCIIMAILLLLVLVLEYFYFNTMQKNMARIDHEMKQINDIYENEIQTNREIKQNTEMTNEMQTNQEM